MRILIVEDDDILGEGLLDVLTLDGNGVDWVLDKESATLALKTHQYAMILLDIGLADGCGLDLLANIRAENNDVPVIILSAYDSLRYKISGLDAGADDYLTKPFKLEELKARIRALHRRREGRHCSLLAHGQLEINPTTKQVTYDNTPIRLGSKEFSIILMLIERPQKIFSKEELESNLYGWGYEIESNAIEVYISNLRKKLGKKTIETIKYMGYRIGGVL